MLPHRKKSLDAPSQDMGKVVMHHVTGCAKVRQSRMWLSAPERDVGRGPVADSVLLPHRKKCLDALRGTWERLLCTMLLDVLSCARAGCGKVSQSGMLEEAPSRIQLCCLIARSA